MATYDNAMEALRRADAAGNTEDARQLAAIAVRLKPFSEQEPNAEGISFTGGLARSFFQGAAQGGGDEAVAGLSAGLNGVLGNDAGAVYDHVLNQERERLDQFRESNPWSATGAEIAGSVSTALLPFGKLAQAGKFLANAGKGFFTGLGLGGLYGFNSGEDGAANRLENAALPAAVGGIVGAAAPLVGAGIKTGVQKLMERAPARRMGTTPVAQRVLSRAMEADGSFAGSGAANLARAGDDAMLADAGPNARTLLDTAIQRSGRAGTVAREAVEDRASRAGQSMSNSLDDAFGPSVGLRSTERGIRQSSAPARQAAYDLAYSKPIDYASEAGMRLERIVKDRVPMSAIRAANDLMRTEGRDASTRHILAHVDDAGNAVFEDLPDVRQLDYITRGLREVADRADGAGKLGGQTQIGNAYSRLSGEIRSLTRELVPEYAEALETAARPIEARNSLQFGSRLLSQRVTRDEAAEMLGQMSGAERFNASQGVRSQIDEALSNVRRAMLDTNMDAREAIKLARDLSSRANREKVGLLIGDEQAAKLFEQLDQSSIALDLRAGVAANSRTFARQSMDDVISEQIDGGAVGSLMEGRPANAGQRFIQMVTGRTPQAKTQLGDEVYDEVVSLLTGPRGAEARAALDGLGELPRNVDLTADQARAMAEYLIGRNPGVTAPAIEAVR